MATHITMPKLSDTMTEGTLLKWLKAEGDTVAMGDSLAEVETDKATMEMEAFDEGIIHKIYIQEGEKAPVGGALAILLAEGEEAPEGADTPPAAPALAAEDPTAPKRATDSAAAQRSGTGAEALVDSQGQKIKVSPLARKVAEKLGVDLTTVAGSGPGGRVTRKDVERASRGVSTAIKSTPAAATAGAITAAAAPAIRPVVGEGDTREPVSGMRAVIAERLLASKTQIPHFYLNIELDAAPILAIRKQINSDSESGSNPNKYTINDFILKAAIDAAVAVPDANASWDGDAIVKFKDVNVAVAVAIEGGLVTPVIRAAQDKKLLEISREIKDMAGRARDKKLTPDEMQGGTLSVSNLGAYGIDTFDAIINPPQAFILSVGNIVDKPVVDPASGEIVAGKRMWIGMSCDHRVIDGAVGATYLAEFRKFIEQPALMLV